MEKHPQQDSIEDIFNTAVSNELRARNLAYQAQQDAQKNKNAQRRAQRKEQQDTEKAHKAFAQHIVKDVFKPLQKTFKTRFSDKAEVHISIFDDKLYLDILTEPKSLRKATKSDDRGSFLRLNSGVISPLYALEAYPKNGKLFVEYKGIDVDPQYRGVALECTEESLITRTSHTLHYLSDRTLNHAQRAIKKRKP